MTSWSLHSRGSCLSPTLNWIVAEGRPGAAPDKTFQVSPAGAVGLMQVLPGRRDKDGEALFDPEVNLARGTEHLARLIKRYDGRLVDALVAYNAGIRRLERWRARFKGLDEDEFIEAIPFTETRTYVKRVLRNAALYRMLYADEGSGAQVPCPIRSAWQSVIAWKIDSGP